MGDGGAEVNGRVLDVLMALHFGEGEKPQTLLSISKAKVWQCMWPEIRDSYSVPLSITLMASFKFMTPSIENWWRKFIGV